MRTRSRMSKMKIKNACHEPVSFIKYQNALEVFNTFALVCCLLSK